jgi:hypothetical protein
MICTREEGKTSDAAYTRYRLYQWGIRPEGLNEQSRGLDGAMSV